jgi:hypothetical protein
MSRSCAKGRNYYRPWQADALYKSKEHMGACRGGLRDGGLLCGGCQRFESAYLQPVNLADTGLV